MLPRATEQLNAIHAMMESGHRSVRLERHTLVLWGLAAAFLILVVRLIFTPERFPETLQRVLASNLFIAALLTAVGVIDLRLTRRARRQRDETLSFVQVQLTKIWWLLVGLIVLINLGMNLNVIPVAGLPMPFISSGGSALVITFVGLGLVESVAMRHKRMEY